ncbi:HAD hydrolase, family IF [Leclercia adecarboxylata]|uniref:HAD hydrolase, family IF n=1 Tax=Leclercia adecarboxylata TaxID=83655 RepID=A0A4U9IEI6_9ENTR|nr:HAD hydrolase, family IF [Leclercia adecarboxylata]
MSLLLWGCTFGHSEARLKQLEKEFVSWFRGHVTAFPVVQERLTNYLNANDADIWLITGSPQSLVEQVYFDTPWLPRVNLIATQMGARVRWLGADHALPRPRKGGAAGEENWHPAAALQRLQRQ